MSAQKKKLVKKHMKDELVEDSYVLDQTVQEVMPDKKKSKKVKTSNKEKSSEPSELSETSELSEPNPSYIEDKPSEPLLVKKSKKEKSVKKELKVVDPKKACVKELLSIPHSKVKNIISNTILNYDIMAVLNEIKGPPETLSDYTKKYIDDLNKNNSLSQQKTYERKKYSSLSVEQKQQYKELKSKGFTDLKTLNTDFDKEFYTEFKPIVLDLSDAPILVKAINKNKYRFSNNTKVYLTSFIDLLVKQLIKDTLLNTQKTGKKNVQVESVKHSYELGKIAESSKTNKLYKLSDEEISTFVLENIDTEKLFQFKTSITDICKETKSALSIEYPEQSDYFNGVVISKQFKNYCSTVICELLVLISKMIRVEVESRNIKTINENIVNTVLQQLFIVYDINFSKTLTYLTDTSTKYMILKQKE